MTVMIASGFDLGVLLQVFRQYKAYKGGSGLLFRFLFTNKDCLFLTAGNRLVFSGALYTSSNILEKFALTPMRVFYLDTVIHLL